MLALLVRIPVSCLTKLLVQFCTEQNYRVTQLNLYRLGTNENKLPLTPRWLPWRKRAQVCAAVRGVSSCKCFLCLSPAIQVVVCLLLLYLNTNWILTELSLSPILLPLLNLSISALLCVISPLLLWHTDPFVPVLSMDTPLLYAVTCCYCIFHYLPFTLARF